MKIRFVYVAAVALIAGSMALAQSSDSPSTQDTHSGSAATATPQTSGQSGVQSNTNVTPCETSNSGQHQMPGAMGANMGQGETPQVSHQKRMADKTAQEESFDASGRAGAGGF